MTFFNNKTQVLKFELTPYGRHLLSVGKLKPDSYEFLDDDVLYDDQYVGNSEIQNQTYERIKFETPKLIPNPSKNTLPPSGTNYKNVLDHFGTINFRSGDTNQCAIGKSSPKTSKTPSFSMLMLDGQIDDVKKTYTGNSLNSSNDGSFENDFIPQFDFELDFFLRRRNRNFFQEDFDKRSFTEVLGDGRLLYVDEDNIMLELKEFGSEYEKENFEIEVYEITGEEQKPFKEMRRLLYFETIEDRLDNDLIVPSKIDNLSLDLEERLLVSHYFEINVDDEISRAELCAKIKDSKLEDRFLDEEINCPDFDQLDKFDIYATRVSPDDLEDCD